MEELKLEGHEFIALCDLLKTMGLCENGGQAKAVIADGLVTVDGVVETRKRCKIKAEQIVEFEGQKVRVSL